MAISPGQDAARGDIPEHRLLVRLGPIAGSAARTPPPTGRAPGDHPAETSRQTTDVTPTADPDLRGIARALEDLVHAVAPGLATSVQIETRTTGRPQVGPPETEPAPAWRTGPAPLTALPARRRTESPGPGTPLTTVQSTRRTRPTGGEETVRAAPGPLEVDVVRRTLTLDGEPVDLTRREFDLIAFLEQHRGQALGREDLMQAVWHSGYVSGDRTVDVHVRRLRVKLGRYAARLVTLRGFGYRLD